MRFNARYIGSHTLLAIAFAWGGIVNCARGQNTSVPADVRFAVEQCQATYEAVKDVAYSFHSHYQGRFSQDQIGTAKDIASIGSELVHKRVVTTTDSGTSEQEIDACLTPNECCDWPHGAIPTQYLFDSLQNISDAAEMAADADAPPHPGLYAFGNGNRFLWVLLRDKGFEWKLDKVERGGNMLLDLTRYQEIPRLGRLTTVFSLDPAKGYEVVNQFGRLIHGNVLRGFRADLKNIDHRGAWYPVKLVERYYGVSGPDDPNSTQKPTWIKETTIDHIRVKPLYSKADFSLSSFHLSKGQEVIQVDATGNRKTLFWSPQYNGLTADPSSELVPSSFDGAPVVSSLDGNNTLHRDNGDRTALCVLLIGSLVALIVIVTIYMRAGRPASR